MLRRRRLSAKGACDYILQGLSREFRDAIGLNVRQPSSNVPPFRAQQWTYDVAGSLAGAASTTASIFFRSGQTEVPEGVNGIMANVDFYFEATNQGALNNIRLFQASVSLNGQVIPGLESLSAGGITLETITDAAGSDAVGSDFPGGRLFVPVKLKSGDAMSFTVTNAGGVTGGFRFLFAGWFYPIEVDADGVLGTVADRGSGRLSSGGIGQREG